MNNSHDNSNSLSKFQLNDYIVKLNAARRSIRVYLFVCNYLKKEKKWQINGWPPRNHVAVIKGDDLKIFSTFLYIIFFSFHSVHPHMCTYRQFISLRFHNGWSLRFHNGWMNINIWWSHAYPLVDTLRLQIVWLLNIVRHINWCKRRISCLLKCTAHISFHLNGARDSSESENFYAKFFRCFRLYLFFFRQVTKWFPFIKHTDTSIQPIEDEKKKVSDSVLIIKVQECGKGNLNAEKKEKKRRKKRKETNPLTYPFRLRFVVVQHCRKIVCPILVAIVRLLCEHQHVDSQSSIALHLSQMYSDHMDILCGKRNDTLISLLIICCISIVDTIRCWVCVISMPSNWAYLYPQRQHVSKCNSTNLKINNHFDRMLTIAYFVT